MHRPHRFLLAPLVLVLALFVGACGDDDDGNPVIPPTTLELNSGTLGNGATYPHTFATAGTFPYHCSFHGGMNGSITVDPASAVTTLGISITDNAFTPANTTVKTGAVVTWTNNGASNHTVTSN
jgi:plastocyanin